MSLAPWDADRALTPELVRALIGLRFPAIDSSTLVQLGSGWEFDVFRTRDDWVFRFPRRAESATLFEAEARAHEVVAAALPPLVAIPRVERIGDPALSFPYRFAGHRFIAGVPADAIDARLLPALAAEIGRFLGAIHSIPVAVARAAGIAEGHRSSVAGNPWVERCFRMFPLLRGHDPVVDRALAWTEEQSPLIRSFDGPLRFIHHDLSPEHLLVDPASGRLNGVLDWTDAIAGDAARDFVFIVTWLGWSFAEDVLKSYPLALDARFRDRLRRSARVLSVLWLAEARDRGLDHGQPVQAVRNAFEAQDTAV